MSYVYTPPAPQVYDVKVQEVPPRFSLLGRDILRLVNSNTLKAQHSLSIGRTIENLAVKANWGQVLGSDPSGEFELGWKLRKDINIFAGLDSKGTKHLDLEFAELLPGLTLTSRNMLQTDPTAVSRPVMLLGARYEQPGIASELSVDVFPRDKSEHLAIFSTVIGREGLSFGGRVALALTPQGSAAVGSAAATDKQHLADYDVGVEYKMRTATVFATTKKKLEKLRFGFIAALSPATDVGAVMKQDRNFRSTRLRIAAATRYQEGVLRGAVDTKGRVVASYSVPLGPAIGTIVFQTNVKHSLSTDSRLGLQLNLA